MVSGGAVIILKKLNTKYVNCHIYRVSRVLFNNKRSIFHNDYELKDVFLGLAGPDVRLAVHSVVKLPSYSVRRESGG